MLIDNYNIHLEKSHGPPLKDIRRVQFQKEMYLELKSRVGI